MPKNFEAGQLIERVAFDKRDMVDDGFGNMVAGPWQEQFQCRAKFVQLRGSETVLAARLQSHSTFVVQVRTSGNTKAVTPDWQMRDVRTGVAYNIREIHSDTSRALLDILAESNVAT